jgi:hypothetical protein
MDDLEFRKFLTLYGISYEEFEGMDNEEKQKLVNKFKAETKTNNLESIGKGLQGLGCLIILVPILLILLYFMFSIIKSLF